MFYFCAREKKVIFQQFAKGRITLTNISLFVLPFSYYHSTIYKTAYDYGFHWSVLYPWCGTVTSFTYCMCFVDKGQWQTSPPSFLTSRQGRWNEMRVLYIYVCRISFTIRSVSRGQEHVLVHTIILNFVHLSPIALWNLIPSLLVISYAFIFYCERERERKREREKERQATNAGDQYILIAIKIWLGWCLFISKLLGVVFMVFI